MKIDRPDDQLKKLKLQWYILKFAHTVHMICFKVQLFKIYTNKNL